MSGKTPYYMRKKGGKLDKENRATREERQMAVKACEHQVF